MRSTTQQQRAYLILAATQLITGSTYLIAKFGLREFHPFTLGFLRFVITGLVYALLFRLVSRRVRPLRQLNVRLLALMGFLAVPLNQALFLYGQRLSHSSHGALLYALTPVMVLLIARLQIGEPLSREKVVGVGLGISGALLILGENIAGFSFDTLTGDLLICTGVVIWAWYSVLMRHALKSHTALEATGYSLMLGALFFVPIGLPFTINQDYSTVTPIGWASVAYLSLLTSVLAYFVWSWALSHIEAGQAAVVSNLQPVVATLLGWLVLSEPITRLFLLGTILTMTGVFITQHRRS